MSLVVERSPELPQPSGDGGSPANGFYPCSDLCGSSASMLPRSISSTQLKPSSEGFIYSAERHGYLAYW